MRDGFDRRAHVVEQAARGHVADQAHDQEHDEALEAAGADADHGAARAAAGQHHAEAEQQPAAEHRDPGHARREIEALGHLHQARRDQRVRADDGDRDGEQPGAEAALVAGRDGVGDGAHRAEIGALDDGAEQEADGEARQSENEGGAHECEKVPRLWDRAVSST